MNSNIEIYQSQDNQIELNVKFEADTAWLTQAQMANLFEQTKQNISLHINNCFKEGELDENSVVKDSLTTAADGKKYNTKYYNLDVIISVGYRVKSKQGTPFRQWATQRLSSPRLCHQPKTTRTKKSRNSTPQRWHQNFEPRHRSKN
jgi:hypothetical protein